MEFEIQIEEIGLDLILSGHQVPYHRVSPISPLIKYRLLLFDNEFLVFFNTGHCEDKALLLPFDPVIHSSPGRKKELSIINQQRTPHSSPLRSLCLLPERRISLNNRSINRFSHAIELNHVTIFESHYGHVTTRARSML